MSKPRRGTCQHSNNNVITTSKMNEYPYNINTFLYIIFLPIHTKIKEMRGKPENVPGDSNQVF